MTMAAFDFKARLANSPQRVRGRGIKRAPEAFGSALAHRQSRALRAAAPAGLQLPRRSHSWAGRWVSSREQQPSHLRTWARMRTRARGQHPLTTPRTFVLTCYPNNRNESPDTSTLVPVRGPLGTGLHDRR